MTRDTQQAYAAWRRAAERGYGPSTRALTPDGMARVDARIRRLQARYEELAEREAERRAEQGMEDRYAGTRD